MCPLAITMLRKLPAPSKRPSPIFGSKSCKRPWASTRHFMVQSCRPVHRACDRGGQSSPSQRFQRLWSHLRFSARKKPTEYCHRDTDRFNSPCMSGQMIMQPWTGTPGRGYVGVDCILIIMIPVRQQLILHCTIKLIIPQEDRQHKLIDAQEVGKHPTQAHHKYPDKAMLSFCLLVRITSHSISSKWFSIIRSEQKQRNKNKQTKKRPECDRRRA